VNEKHAHKAKKKEKEKGERKLKQPKSYVRPRTQKQPVPHQSKRGERERERERSHYLVVGGSGYESPLGNAFITKAENPSENFKILHQHITRNLHSG
jgi:hypothetical protein